MGNLTVTGLDETVLAKLSRRAAEHGRTLEAEAAEILSEGVDAEQPRDWQHMLETVRQQTAGTISTKTIDILYEGKDDAR